MSTSNTFTEQQEIKDILRIVFGTGPSISELDMEFYRLHTSEILNAHKAPGTPMPWYEEN